MKWSLEVASWPDLTQAWRIDNRDYLDLGSISWSAPIAFAWMEARKNGFLDIHLTEDIQTNRSDARRKSRFARSHRSN